MVTLRSAVIFVALWTPACGVHAYQTPSREFSNVEQVLRSSTDQNELERVATSLARSGTSSNLELLSRFLRDTGFLHRLDPSQDRETPHLGKVMHALAEHPTQQVADLCLTLAEDPAYVAVDERRILLLEIIAKVRPMSQRAVAVFQNANDRGYFAFSAPLLTANASPRALALFETMMLDKDTPLETRVECLHVSVLPRRTELPILQTADQMVSRASERGIVIGVTESVFDFR